MPEASGACYDAWFELLPPCLNAFNAQLKLYDYAVDLYGQKASAGCNAIIF
jgi:hypothetical protein